jgi:hypothetical protein
MTIEWTHNFIQLYFRREQCFFACSIIKCPVLHPPFQIIDHFDFLNFIIVYLDIIYLSA